jgi:hypothetical protein
MAAVSICSLSLVTLNEHSSVPCEIEEEGNCTRHPSQKKKKNLLT